MPVCRRLISAVPLRYILSWLKLAPANGDCRFYIVESTGVRNACPVKRNIRTLYLKYTLEKDMYGDPEENLRSQIALNLVPACNACNFSS